MTTTRNASRVEPRGDDLDGDNRFQSAQPAPPSRSEPDVKHGDPRAPLRFRERVAAERATDAAERAATVDALARKNAELARHTRRGPLGAFGRIVLLIGAMALVALMAGWIMLAAFE